MTRTEKNRFENKVGIATYKNGGPIDMMVAYEIADDMDIEVSKRQAQNAIKLAVNNYGF